MLPESNASGQHRFLLLGGYTLVSRQIAAAADALAPSLRSADLVEVEDGACARSQALRWCAGSAWQGGGGREQLLLEALDKEDHDYRTINLLLDLVFASNLYAAHAPPAPPACVLYLDAAGALGDRDRLSGAALLALLDFLGSCSRLLQQQALNDLSLLMERSEALRAFFLSTPSWQPRLLRLLQRNCTMPSAMQADAAAAASPAATSQRPSGGANDHPHAESLRAAAFHSLPSVVTWLGLFESGTLTSPSSSVDALGAAKADGDELARPGPLPDVAMSDESDLVDEEEGASGLVGLVGKVVCTVAHDMMLVPNGWRVMAHCLDSIRSKQLLGGSAASQRKMASDGVQLVRGMVCAACKVQAVTSNLPDLAMTS